MNGRRRDRLLRKSNWYGTRQRTAPVIQHIRMAAVLRLEAPCHEGVWRNGDITPYVLNCSILR